LKNRRVLKVILFSEVRK